MQSLEGVKGKLMMLLLISMMILLLMARIMNLILEVT
jgi:hypothetical protein